MTRITLTKPHTHAGRPRAAGDELMVDESTAAWIIKHKCGQPSMETPQPVVDHPVIPKRERKHRASTEDTHHGE